ncbi:MAG: hypothetical protein R2713_03685 [Ilumatobacteraceae bacterium]
MHVYANIVTVNLRRGFGSDGLDEIVRELYQYWKPGMEPAVFVEEAPAEVAASTGGGDAGGAARPRTSSSCPRCWRERSEAALALAGQPLTRRSGADRFTINGS